MTDKRLKTELLSPGGSLRKIKTALLYGADAIYAGTPDMSLRTKSDMTLNDLVEASKIIKKNHKKLYLTLNLFSHNRDIDKLPQFVNTVLTIDPNGLIIADPGVFAYCQQHLPSHIELHVSTQANVCSSLSVDFWRQQGASLCVLAREVSFNEIKQIKQQCQDIKIETFIHGSMCMTYSGRCLLSNFMAERGANQGSCAHSCRWNYKVKIKLKNDKIFELNMNEHNQDLFDFVLEEEFREGEYYPIEEDGMGAYILNSKDLCLMPVLNDYLAIGIDSLKIEGRNKSEYYAAITAKSYRLAIDSWYQDPQNWHYKPYLNELMTIANRGYTTAFHDGRLTNLAHNYDVTKTLSEYSFAGIIVDYDHNDIILEIKNFLQVGDVLEFISPFVLEPIRLRMYEFIDNSNLEVKSKISPGRMNQAIRISLDLFHNYDKQQLKELLPIFTVVRKPVIIDEKYENFYKRNVVSYNVENDVASNSILERLNAIINEDKLNKQHNVDNSQPKKNNINVCCSKGCNGCLQFWYDPKYSKLRDKLHNKALGEKLIKNIDFTIEEIS